jgi:hypothetical protein
VLADVPTGAVRGEQECQRAAEVAHPPRQRELPPQGISRRLYCRDACKCIARRI